MLLKDLLLLPLWLPPPPHRQIEDQGSGTSSRPGVGVTLLPPPPLWSRPRQSPVSAEPTLPLGRQLVQLATTG